MKLTILSLLLCTALIFSSCRQEKSESVPPAGAVNEQDDDSLRNDSNDSTTIIIPSDPVQADNPGTHPITLQWIGWDRPGTAALQPVGGGWYTIDGSQTNDRREYLNIKGRIRRVSDRELLFEGTVETRVEYNNGGQPCFKRGKLHFVAKGNRKYYRLQDMENCAGGNLLDYVDIYPGSSSL